jgi:hypothetical protein
MNLSGLKKKAVQKIRDDNDRYDWTGSEEHLEDLLDSLIEEAVKETVEAVRPGTLNVKDITQKEQLAMVFGAEQCQKDFDKKVNEFLNK